MHKDLQEHFKEHIEEPWMEHLKKHFNAHFKEHLNLHLMENIKGHFEEQWSTSRNTLKGVEQFNQHFWEAHGGAF